MPSAIDVEDAEMAESASTSMKAHSQSHSSSSSSSQSLTTKTRPATSLAADLDLPWIEKYRPRVLADVVGNPDTIERLKSIAKHGNMPNLIVSGPPGIGKTTSILCLAREMLGSSFDVGVLELNASDERGIDVVREKVKMFAHSRVSLPPGCHKLIILDEADSLTQGAQQALRRTMELFSATTRFALACNTSASIIEPIQSRCAIIRLTRLSDVDVLRRIKQVMESERIVDYNDSGLEAIVFTASGDMRAALNTLQSTAAGLGAITAENVFQVVDQPHPTIIKTILSLTVQGDIKAASVELLKLVKNGYSAIDLITTMFRIIKSWNNSNASLATIDDRLKLELSREVSMTQIRVAEGVASNVQLTGLLARMGQLAKGIPTSTQ